ncbi:TIGR00730 family Rossman fold protein [Aerococcaceae bacterium INB8]|uniref:Cytokinin riboside 5'-monophosphate phosphoribohydrolase n=1 Tax=Ruoffia halotolerans TaxID=2748684 RepID=A0A839A6U8_9LACT|nr:TIGR00730 family Rossman fold protein [Ruoffia halotolerans]MBA5729478.1 TIGR00730 family Rossman fold protein [Ruoffia halotolerans]
MKIAVYCGAAIGNNKIYEEAAIEFGKWIGKKNHELIYGGGNVGLMGKLADSVIDSGGEVIGVMPDFLIQREIAHIGLSELITVDTMSERKQIMLEKSDLCVALPGGPGTLEEIVEAISWSRVGQSNNPCIFLNINKYYEGIKAFYKHMVDEGFLTYADFERIGFINSFDDIEEFVSNLDELKIRDYSK